MFVEKKKMFVKDVDLLQWRSQCDAEKCPLKRQCWHVYLFCMTPEKNLRLPAGWAACIRPETGIEPIFISGSLPAATQEEVELFAIGEVLNRIPPNVDVAFDFMPGKSFVEKLERITSQGWKNGIMYPECWTRILMKIGERHEKSDLYFSTDTSVHEKIKMPHSFPSIPFFSRSEVVFCDKMADRKMTEALHDLDLPLVRINAYMAKEKGMNEVTFVQKAICKLKDPSRILVFYDEKLSLQQDLQHNSLFKEMERKHRIQFIWLPSDEEDEKQANPS